MANVDTRYAQTASHKGENTAFNTYFLMQPGKFAGTNRFAANTLQPGDVIRITAWGTIATGANAGNYLISLYRGPLPGTGLGSTKLVGVPIQANTALARWDLLVMITIRPGNLLVCEGVWIVEGAPEQIGLPTVGNASLLRAIPFNPAIANTFEIAGQMLAANVGNSISLEQCVIEYLPRAAAPMAPDSPMRMEQGRINGLPAPASFSLAGVNTGVLAASAVYSSSTC